MCKKFFFVMLVMILIVLASCGGGGDGIRGTWTGEFGDERRVYEFTAGGRFTRTYYISTSPTTNPLREIEGWTNVEGGLYRRILEGTYSISGDQIEFVFDEDRPISVLSFSRTENTISIHGFRYERE